MATIDQQFIEFIVKTLVSKPDEVKVDRTIDERGVLLSLTVDPEDVGRVIGKRGATAQSIRTLLRVLGTKNGARYNLKIINTDDYEAAPRAESHDATELAEDKAEMAAGAAVEEEINEQEDDSSDLAEKTRAELADLDDLDI
jgi:predicted RNA-binding protein YlqC (UPF0109 family)